MRINAFLPFLLLPLLIFAKSVVYKVYFGIFSAGRIEINFSPDRVEVTGASGGVIGWFYRYKLLMVYDFKNPNNTFMTEEENGKKKTYNFKRILEKKSWLPLVVKLLSETPNPDTLKTIKVGEYTVTLEKYENDNFFFRISGSKNTKKIKLFRWKKGDFPKRIEIETKAGTLVLIKT
ncbi:MAG TPA: hypothetical protein EYH48_04340 [Aquifex aeolicus]|uniref:DUF3108 domain-containing protein n=1 Tax=Aquifex aeolicus TaxID=63363 RepID=A0A9D0YSC5_AQUAO|nr:hypothetical protein [Aquificales bacterium]HIP98852.1 hypothetical protein [Aquifex aeolicus]HIQ26540.1 hypothetical protein [Aquifex aeolicus]